MSRGTPPPAHADQRAAVRNAVWDRLRPYARPDTRFVYEFGEFIPDFEGSERLWDGIRELPCFAGGGVVFVTPDNGLQEIRRALILAGRPMLQTIAVAMGFHFFPPGRITPPDATFASTLDGAQLLAQELTLDDVRKLGKIDFVVTGACAVDPISGVRFGKGHGYFDTEWAILSELGVVDAGTPIVICVHDYQVVETGLEPLAHDTAGRFIVTPERTIEVPDPHRNPIGIRWDLVDDERLAAIEPLRQLLPQRPAPGIDGSCTAVVQVDTQHLVRERVWSELRKVAKPDSRFHWDFGSFIADFEGSEACAAQLRQFESWKRSDLLFITPDNSTEAARRFAIADGKRLLMTTYGIRRGFLLLEPGRVSPGEEGYAATLDGMDALARPVSLAEIAELGRVGLLVTGGSAVNLEGLRIGKGHGYFDLEWAILSEVGAVDDASEIVDVVHDCQVVDVHIEPAAHDVRVDWVLTPTRSLRIEGPGRPLGRVLWDLVAGSEFEHLPPVIELASRRRQQRQGGEP